MSGLNLHTFEEVSNAFSFNNLKSSNKAIGFTSHLKNNVRSTINESSQADETIEKCSQTKKADSFFVMDVLSESFFP